MGTSTQKGVEKSGMGETVAKGRQRLYTSVQLPYSMYKSTICPLSLEEFTTA